MELEVHSSAIDCIDNILSIGQEEFLRDRIKSLVRTIEMELEVNC